MGKKVTSGEMVDPVKPKLKTDRITEMPTLKKIGTPPSSSPRTPRKRNSSYNAPETTIPSISSIKETHQKSKEASKSVDNGSEPVIKATSIPVQESTPDTATASPKTTRRDIINNKQKTEQVDKKDVIQPDSIQKKENLETEQREQEIQQQQKQQQKQQQEQQQKQQQEQEQQKQQQEQEQKQQQEEEQ